MADLDNAWEELNVIDNNIINNLKEDEALFGICGCYTRKKKDIDQVDILIWNPASSINNDYLRILDSSHSFIDEDSLDILVEEYNYVFPTGLFLLRCWGFETQSMTDCGIEYDYEYSRNYSVYEISDKNLLNLIDNYLSQKSQILQLKNMIEEALDYLNFAHFIQDGDVRRGIDDCCNCLNDCMDKINAFDKEKKWVKH